MQDFIQFIGHQFGLTEAERSSPAAFVAALERAGFWAPLDCVPEGSSLRTVSPALPALRLRSTRGR